MPCSHKVKHRNVSKTSLPKLNQVSTIETSEDQSMSSHVEIIQSSGRNMKNPDPSEPGTGRSLKSKRRLRKKLPKGRCTPRSGRDRIQCKFERFHLPRIHQHHHHFHHKPTKMNQLEKFTVPRKASTSGTFYVDNEYTRFTISVDNFLKERGEASLVEKEQQGISILRSQRLFQLTKQLKTCHHEYNNHSLLEDRDNFLITEILQRYIMGLDLALNEQYFGIGLGLLLNIYDTTKLMLPLYSNLFYRKDGTHETLPIVLLARNGSAKSLTPIIYALNRIPHSSINNATENSHLRLETHLVKLQLEALLLVLAPVESMIFRATLEVIPTTAFTALKRLAILASNSKASTLIWPNNSRLHNEYEKLLQSFGLADSIGANGSLVLLKNSEDAYSARRNCNSELEMSDDEDCCGINAVKVNRKKQ